MNNADQAPKQTILELFTKSEQQLLVDAAQKTGDEFLQAMLGFPLNISEYEAWEFSRFIKNFITIRYSGQDDDKDPVVPVEFSGLLVTAKKYIEDLGFKYQWHKKELDEGRVAAFREFDSALRRHGIEFSNIVINKTPVESLECLLDYGNYCEVFYFQGGEKTKLKRFDDFRMAQDYYQELLLANPLYYLRKLHFRFAENKELALHCAKALNDEISYDILKNDTQLTDEKTAYHFSRFFWKMVDMLIENDNSETAMGQDGFSDAESLMNVIGGFVISSGFRYQWYREESTPERLQLAQTLEAELKAAGLDMTKIIINHEPQQGCYCFLDFGDHCDYFYYRDDEEEKPPRRAYTKDFSENVQYFKEWVLFIDNLKTKPGDQQKE